MEQKEFLQRVEDELSRALRTTREMKEILINAPRASIPKIELQMIVVLFVIGSAARCFSNNFYTSAQLSSKIKREEGIFIPVEYVNIVLHDFLQKDRVEFEIIKKHKDDEYGEKIWRLTKKGIRVFDDLLKE